MAGEQRKYHFASSIILDGTQDHYNVKKSKSGFSRYNLDMKSCISLKWDDRKRSVVAKTEQIGLSRRELIHFADGILPYHNNLADVITVPPEIFRLDNLDDVLTYEVWQNCLSESERSLLTQFLPKYSNPDRVVQQLLNGDNFHFGNPFLKWGALLCSGNLHPDNILTTERRSRASKKTYYSELQTYHKEMIENLQTWKGVVNLKDLKEDTIRRMWRSRSNSKKRVFTTEPGVSEMEENIYTPESSCQAASELACSSDNPNRISIHGAISRREGSKTSKIDDSSDGLKDVSRLSNGEKLVKHNIKHGDGERYMSYIKVSKSQHQRIKSSMKHSSSSIQPKSLDSVLGNIDAFHIQPFEVYEEEEWQKLLGHWLQLANRDLPPFVANWRNLQLQRLQINKSLVQEMEEKLKRQKETFDQDKEESSCDVSLEPLDNLDTNDALAEMKELDAEPSMPAVEVPALTIERTPLIIEEDAPATAMTLDESPAMTGEEAPAITDEKSPAMTEDESHTVTNVESGILIEDVYHKSFPFKAFDQGESAATATTLDKSPSMTEEETPTMAEEESPAMAEEESPSMTNDGSSKLANEDELQSIGLMEQQQDDELGEVGFVTFEDKERENFIEDAGNFVSVSTQSDLMHQTISLSNDCLDYDNMNIEICGNLDLKKEETPPSSSNFPLNLANIDVPGNQEDSIASAADTWPQVNMPGLFYPSTGYSSSNGLSLRHAQVEEQSSQLLRLDAFNLERMDAFNGENIRGRGTLQRHSGPSPLLGPYHIQDENELYPSFYNQKHTGIHFQPAANLLAESGQFIGRMKEQSHSSLPLELGQKDPSEFYLNQNNQGSMYSNGGSYPIQSQETLPLNIRDWTANTVNISAPPQSHMNGGLLSQNWYSRDNPDRGNWSSSSCMQGSVDPSQGIGSGSSSDQSLFRVLSECNELQSGAPYDPMSSSRRPIQSGSFGGVHTTRHMLPQSINSLNYLNDLDSVAGYKTISSLGTMNMQHPTPGLEETIDNKTFRRSWNQ